MKSTMNSIRLGALITFLALAVPNDDVRPLSPLGLGGTASTLRAEEPAKRGPLDPDIAPESRQAERAMGGFRVPEGIQVSLFAAEPMMANPVAFCFDE